MPTRSPFPGMDPWLERYWRDVHTEITVDLRRQIAPQLPADLFVTIEESVYLVGGGDADRTFAPDVSLFEGSTSEGPPSDVAVEAAGGLAVAEPVRFLLRADPPAERWLEIRHVGDDEPLVTAIEVLSPTNKRTAAGRADYLEKRQAYTRAGANVLEIDLLRGGPDLTGLTARQLTEGDPRLPSAYRCAVRQAAANGPVALSLYPLPLRQRLSRIPVPLRDDDPAVTVDLQQPIDAAYRLGGFARRIDYDRRPDPPLSPDDAAWAADRVAAWRATG